MKLQEKTFNRLMCVACLLIYIACWLFTAAGLMRDDQYRAARIGYLNCDNYRRDLGLALGWSIVPIIPWVVAPFVTGFYEHGFGFSKLPQCLEVEKKP